jgi:hypothetical protein
MTICYAITEGEYSDYRVRGIYTTKEKADAALCKYGIDAEIEEFPLDPDVPGPPEGMSGYKCGESIFGEVFASSRTPYEMKEWRKEKMGEVIPEFGGKYGVWLWAQNEKHAIKIAAEKFARKRAIDAGIAC